MLFRSREDSREIFDYFIRDKNNVEALYFNKQYLDTNSFYSTLDKNCDLLFHGYHDFMRNDKYKGSFNRSIYFVEGFYKFYDIEYMIRVDGFIFKRDHILENRFYDEFVKKHGEKYVLYHDDPDRNIIIDFNKSDKFSYVNLNDISNNIFEVVKVLENSMEVYITDSIWATFCYLLDAKYNIFSGRKVNLYSFSDRSGSCISDKSINRLEPINLENWIINHK